jgi:hypothetical protein
VGKAERNSETVLGRRRKELSMGRVSAFLGMVLYMYPEKNG